MAEADEPITFVAAIANSTSALKIEGEPDAGGRLILEIPGSDLEQLLQLTRFRGRILRVSIAIMDGGT